MTVEEQILLVNAKQLVDYIIDTSSPLDNPNYFEALEWVEAYYQYIDSQIGETIDSRTN